ncbi:hypothetical protein Bbelb_018240 [Branchiostoma belcheri]|nr:hypothetical protein Bbelb_018240 [Branchiostoma belcheri]
MSPWTSYKLTSYKFDIRAIDEVRTLDNQADALLDEQEDQLAWLAFCGTDEEHADAEVMLKSWFNKWKHWSKAEELRAQARVKIGQGPLTSQLDPLLQRFGVKRQAFHSQSFIGNHEDAINELTAMVEVTLNTICKEDSEQVQATFPLVRKVLPWVLARMEDTAISELDKAIKEFLQF